MTKNKKKTFKKKQNYKIACFSLSVEAIEKLNDIAEYKGENKTQVLNNLIYYEYKRLYYDKPTNHTPQGKEEQIKANQETRRKIKKQEEWNEIINTLMMEDIKRIDAQRKEEERKERENKKASQKTEPQKIKDPLNKALDNIAEEKARTTKQKYKSVNKNKKTHENAQKPA